MAESAPCLFSLFYRSTLFWYDYTQIKVYPLQFQIIPYSYLYDQKLLSIFSSFCGQENMRQTAIINTFDSSLFLKIV